MKHLPDRDLYREEVAREKRGLYLEERQRLEEENELLHEQLDQAIKLLCASINEVAVCPRCLRAIGWGNGEHAYDCDANNWLKGIGE